MKFLRRTLIATLALAGLGVVAGVSASRRRAARS